MDFKRLSSGIYKSGVSSPLIHSTPYTINQPNTISGVLHIHIVFSVTYEIYVC